MKLVIVRKPFGGHFPGDKAGFPDAEAESLVKQGLAVFPEAPASQPVQPESAKEVKAAPEAKPEPAKTEAPASPEKK